MNLHIIKCKNLKNINIDNNNFIYLYDSIGLIKLCKLFLKNPDKYLQYIIKYIIIKDIKTFTTLLSKCILEVYTKENINNNICKNDIVYTDKIYRISKEKVYNKIYKLVDMCAGTGAFSLAFELTNRAKVIFANDFELSSKSIYDINNVNKLTLKDIHNIDIINEINPFDILTAGFPCQPFSIAGNQNGFDDSRSNVFFKLISIMIIHKPRIVIFENVKNLLTHDNGNTFKIITKKIAKAGYKYKFKIINTCELTNIPQNRERIYIICFRFNFDFCKFDFPIPINNKIMDIKDLLETDVNDDYYYNSRYKIWDNIKDEITKKYTIYQYRRYYVRENKNNLCPTLTANMGTGGHNVPLIRDDKGIRKLTPLECFRLQGFPIDYKMPPLSDSKLYKLAGNAVSFSVIKKIVNKLFLILE
jgi:DNA (cytosine-5)-methyltransferase 1